LSCTPLDRSNRFGRRDSEHMFDRLKIRDRVLLGFGLLLLLIAGLASTSVFLGSKTQYAVSEMQRTSTVVMSLKDVLLDIRSARVATWSYLAVGDAKYLEDQADAFEQFSQDYQALETHIVTPQGRRLITAFRDSIIELEAKVKAADALKATGIPLGAPAMVSALRDLDDAAAKDKALAAKAVSFDQDLQDKAAAAASDQLKLTGEISIAGAIVALLVGTTVALIIGRGIVTPIRAMTEAMVALADNNLQTSIPGTERTDEIGDMAKAVLVFKDNAVRAAGIAAEEKAGNAEISAAIGRAAENDLTVRVELGSKTGFVRNIGVAINKLLDISSETLAGIDLKTRQVATAVTDASAAIGQVSGGVRDQTGAVNEVARALTESVEAIRLVSESAKVADEKGLAATKLVERSQVLVEQLAQTVETIAQNSRKISQITEVIAGIANRTHILSLNAAIEAARAGEHGKGFVVVAQEVGKLAESAAQNTRQITDIVEQATADVAEGRLASAAVSETMNAIAGEVSQTSQMIRSIAVAMEQQRATVTHIEGNLTDLRGIASGNAAAAEEITTTMIQLSKLADEQRLQLAKFRTA
jgi:methyl-accepting chemotaxis protein